MSVSMEALAMAGADCYEWGMDVEEWEREDIELEPPPHLLADEEEKEEYLSTASHFSEDNDTVDAVAADCDKIPNDGRSMRGQNEMAMMAIVMVKAIIKLLINVRMDTHYSNQ